MTIKSLSNTIIRIKNANLINDKFLKIPLTGFTLQILKILKSEGFIEDYYPILKKNEIVVKLQYKKKLSMIQKIIQITKPGLKKYIKVKTMKKIDENMTDSLISSSNGIMNSKTSCLKKIGGEILFKII